MTYAEHVMDKLLRLRELILEANFKSELQRQEALESLLEVQRAEQRRRNQLSAAKQFLEALDDVADHATRAGTEIAEENLAAARAHLRRTRRNLERTINEGDTPD